MACDCEDCRMKGWLHIPTGLVFYHFSIKSLMEHNLFKKTFPIWTEDAFEKLPEHYMLLDYGFNQAVYQWKEEGIHRVNRQCSLLRDIPAQTECHEEGLVMRWRDYLIANPHLKEIGYEDPKS